MPHTCCLLMPSTYRDSVVLMQLSQTLDQLPGVQQAAVMMGAPQNKALLQDAGLLTTEGETASANDLLICVRAESILAAEAAIREAEQHVAHRQATVDDAGETAPRTLESALRRLPEANLACISVPGQYARHEARNALAHGLHVFLFSDHVEVEAEIELKQFAAQHGLLVMGPDCGTAILNGIPIGFANQTRRGPVGLISASGTGLQQVVCMLAQQGIGVSQAIGVGGRDLDQRIGGHSMRAALQALAHDADTQVIVLISKPPDAAVAASLAQAAAQVDKPCVLAFLGQSASIHLAPSVHGASTLEAAALTAGALARGEPLPPPPQDVPSHLIPSLEAARTALRPAQQAIRALYCGGTLAYEALWLLRCTLADVVSNLDGTWGDTSDTGHVILDLGAEEFTRGRPHPMIDPTVRHQYLIELIQQPEVAVVLCDVMLGWGSHDDPAGELAATWQEVQARASADGRQLVGIATVCGTPDDPQDYEQQCQVLRAHGFMLADSNAQAVRLAAAVVGAQVDREQSTRATAPSSSVRAFSAPNIPEYLPALFASGPRVINLGLELFAAQLTACRAPVVHVDWRPPAGGDTRLASLLERLR